MSNKQLRVARSDNDQEATTGLGNKQTHKTPGKVRNAIEFCKAIYKSMSILSPMNGR